MWSGGMKEFLKKYGKVGLGVHFSVSAVSMAGLYAAISNNVDVDSLFHKLGLHNIITIPISTSPSQQINTDAVAAADDNNNNNNKKTAEMVASSGGALALAVLCNKALFPIRVPITFLITPPVARFFARRRILNTHL